MLLDDIRSEISAAGGRYKLAHAIIRENPDLFNYNTKRKIKAVIGVLRRMQRYRLAHPKAPISNRNRTWSEEDILYLRKHYGFMKTGQLAHLLKRTTVALALKFAAVATEEEKINVKYNGRYVYKKDNLRKSA